MQHRSVILQQKIHKYLSRTEYRSPPEIYESPRISEPVNRSAPIVPMLKTIYGHEFRQGPYVLI